MIKEFLSSESDCLYFSYFPEPKVKILIIDKHMDCHSILQKLSVNKRTQFFSISFYFFIYAKLNIVSSKHLGFISSSLKSSYTLNQHHWSICTPSLLLFRYETIFGISDNYITYELTILMFIKHFIIYENWNMIEYIIFSWTFNILHTNVSCMLWVMISPNMNSWWDFTFTFHYFCLLV